MPSKSTPITEQRLAEIETRANAATPLPWYRSFTGDGIPCVSASHPEDYHGVPICVQGMFLSEDNMEFIAHARQDVPDLCAEVLRLQEKCGEYCPEGVSIFHTLTREEVACPECGDEIEDPWDNKDVTIDDSGNWHGVIECPNCSTPIEVHSQSIHFWTTEKARR